MATAAPPRVDLDVHDVAALLGLQWRTVLRLVHRRELTGYKIAGRFRFSREDVQAFLDRSRISS